MQPHKKLVLVGSWESSPSVTLQLEPRLLKEVGVLGILFF
jgi:hypothetical protein